MCRVRDGPSISAKAAPLRWEGAYIYIYNYIYNYVEQFGHGCHFDNFYRSFGLASVPDAQLVDALCAGASSQPLHFSSCQTVTFQGVAIISSRRAGQHTNGERTQCRTWDMHTYAYATVD